MLTSCKGQSNNPSTIADSPTTQGLPGDTVSKLGDHLWYIYQDKKNNYWFGSNGQGLFRQEGQTIIQYTTKDGLSNDTIRQIQEDQSGNIYISTFQGISKFDGTTFTTLQPIKSDEWKLEETDLWFYVLGKKNEGVYRYDGHTLHDLKFPKHYLHDEIFPRTVNSFFSPYEVYSIYKDRKGAMWFGTSVFGACRFDGSTVKWMYEDDLIYVPNGGTFGIRSIFEDKEGSFWMCNTFQKFQFDFEQTKKSDRLQYTKTAGIGDKQIFNGDDYIYYSYVVEDNDGNIWLTTWDQGVYKYDGKNIIHYDVKAGAQDVNLVSMYKDRQGVLWLGTMDHGVFWFDGKTFIND